MLGHPDHACSHPAAVGEDRPIAERAKLAAEKTPQDGLAPRLGLRRRGW